MTLNIDRLNKAVQFAIDEHVFNALGKDSKRGFVWSQDVWGRGVVTDEQVDVPQWGDTSKMKVVCTTGCCLAGAVAVNEGDKFVVNDYVSTGVTTSAELCLTKNGEVRDISQRACDLLGIDDPYTEEGDLFEGDNEIDDVLRIAHHLAREHGFELTVDTQALDALREREDVDA